MQNHNEKKVALFTKSELKVILIILSVLLFFSFVAKDTAAATNTFRWNFTGAQDDGWTHVTTGGGTADAFTADRWQSDGAGTQYAEAWFNISQPTYNVDLDSSYPINFSYDIDVDLAQYWVIGFNEIYTHTGIYDDWNLHVHLRAADTPNTVRISTQAFSVANYSSCNVGTDVDDHKKVNLVMPNSTTVDVYLGGSLVCTRQINEGDVRAKDLLMIMGRVANNKIDNITFEYTVASGGVPETPSLTLATNLTDYVNSTANPFRFSVDSIGTVINTTDTWNVTVYLNGTLNQTILNVANLNTTKLVINLTYGYDQVGYNVNVHAEHGHDAASSNVSKLNIFLDSVTPTVTTTLDNNSVFFKQVDTLNYSATIADTNLFAGNFSIFRLNSDGSFNSTVHNQFWTNINETSLTFNFSKTLATNTTFIIERYQSRTVAWDSHTANSPRAPSWTTAPDTIRIDGDIEIGGRIKENLTEFLLASDRYKFKVTFEDDALSHNFTIMTLSNDLTYLPYSGYQGHFVVLSLNRWIDFEGLNIATFQAVRLGDNYYRIFITHNLPTDEVEFESIGDLNTFTTSSYFNITDGFTFFARDTITNATLTNFTVEVWNSTGIIQNRTAVGNNVSFNITSGTYSLNFTHPDYARNSTSATFSSGGNFTWNVFATNSLYIFVYDEQTLELIDDRNVTIQVINFENESNEYITNTGFTFQSGFVIGNYELRTFAGGYAPRSYYLTITGSDTQTIDIYLLNTSVTYNQYKNLEVVDESGVPIFNATVDMQKFFISCNCYKSVEMTKTSDVGKSFVFANLYETLYKFQISVGGDVKKVTSEIRLDTRDLYITVPLLESGLDGYFEVADGTYAAIEYDEDTNIWSYSWASDTSTIRNGRLTVTRVTQYAETELFTQNVNATSSTIVYNMTAYVNQSGQFIAKGYVTSSTTSEEFVATTKTIDFSQYYVVFGLTGVLIALVIILFLAFLGAYNPAIAIILAVFGFVITRMFGLIYIDISWLIGLVIVAVIYAIGVGK